MEPSEEIAKVIEHARLIATAAHYGQFRRDGVTPYITHPEAVAAAVEDKFKPLAWLHDVPEGTFISLIALDNSSLPRWVLDPLWYLTRENDLDYGSYIRRICRDGGISAITVKIADMRHNLSCNPSQRSIEKSKWALPMLEKALNESHQIKPSQG